MDNKLIVHIPTSGWAIRRGAIVLLFEGIFHYDNPRLD